MYLLHVCGHKRARSYLVSSTSVRYTVTKSKVDIPKTDVWLSDTQTHTDTTHTHTHY